MPQQPKVVLILRHSEALHNVFAADKNRRDPDLSYLGVLQCGSFRQHLRKHVPMAEQIELIVSSPMRRTLQTALYGFSWLVQKGVPVVARAEWQEISDRPCDTGSSPRQLMAEFPSVDFSSLDPLYPAKSGPFRYTQQAVQQRGRDARKWLRERPERCIAVVSHSAFLRTSVVQVHFANADYRVFDFDPNDAEGRLVEWDLSAQAGGAMGRSRKGPINLKPKDFGGKRPPDVLDH